MTKHFNKKEIKPARRSLRRNAPLAEKLIWHYIRKKQICGERFLRQYSVDYYVIDFYCPRLKLAVEADGPSHFSSIKAIKYDEKRQKHLEDFGISFLRFTNEEIYQDLENVISKIEERVKELQKIKG